MTAVIELAADALGWIRWAGAAYLVWVGIKTWRTPEDFAAVTAVPVIFWRGCLVAAANPKTLLFNVAFIPQFVGAGEVSALTPTTVAAVYLSVVLLGDVLWVMLATSARRALSRYSSWRNRLTGAFLTAAGVGLALSRR